MKIKPSHVVAYVLAILAVGYAASMLSAPPPVQQGTYPTETRELVYDKNGDPMYVTPSAAPYNGYSSPDAIRQRNSAESRATADLQELQFQRQNVRDCIAGNDHCELPDQ